MRTLIAPAVPATSDGPASKSVLIVEDEPRIQVLASSIATKLGYASTPVSSGMEAIDAYREALTASEPFSLVVMDLALPGGMSGLEATQAIKQIHEAAKIIVSSAYLEQPARDAVLEHGFAGILPKPYTAERLACEFDRVLNEDLLIAPG